MSEQEYTTLKQKYGTVYSRNYDSKNPRFSEFYATLLKKPENHSEFEIVMNTGLVLPFLNKKSPEQSRRDSMRAAEYAGVNNTFGSASRYRK